MTRIVNNPIGFFMAPFAVDLSKTLPTTRFICPTAKEINLTCRHGAKHHAWVLSSSRIRLFIYSLISLLGTKKEIISVPESRKAAQLSTPSFRKKLKMVLIPRRSLCAALAKELVLPFTPFITVKLLLEV